MLTIYSVQNAFGSDQFTLTLTDSNGGTDSILVTLTVNSVNDDPVIQNPSTIQSDPAWTQDEDFGYFNFDFTAFESDVEDGDLDLTWSISGIDLSLFSVGNQSAADDVLTIYSVQNAFGSDQFTLTLTDSNGGTDSILVTLTVNSVNDDPVIQNPSTIQSDPAWTAR